MTSNEFDLGPSEKRPTYEFLSDSGIFYRVNVISCNLCARAKVNGHIELKIEKNTSFGKLVKPFQILFLVSDLCAMAG